MQKKFSIAHLVGVFALGALFTLVVVFSTGNGSNYQGNIKIPLSPTCSMTTCELNTKLTTMNEKLNAMANTLNGIPGQFTQVNTKLGTLQSTLTYDVPAQFTQVRNMIQQLTDLH